MIMTIAHEYKHFTDGSREIIQNVAESLLIYILRLYERRITNETVTTTKNEMIDDLIKYIRYNFGSNITLEFLAAYAHLSPEYLSRYFKKCTGKKLSDFITETRIEKAKYRLRTSTQTINDICEYCGYRSISNFQKAFKKAVGMSAGEYRKKYE
jgi:AraC-like DNA-binding protein